MTKHRGLIAAGLSIVLVICLALRNDSSTLCSDLEYLRSQSLRDFEEISLASTMVPLDEESTSFTLDGASSCFLVFDPERSSYQCNWEHEQQDDAERAFRSLSEEVGACLAPATAREDASVNHPDFWASSYFELPGQAISVSLKNKLLLKKSFVSIQVDGLK